eukprot:Rmarinus@m.11285
MAIEHMAAETERDKQRRKQLEEMEAVYMERVAAAEARRDELKTELANANETIQDLSSQLRSMRSESNQLGAALRSTITGLEDQLRLQKSEMDELRLQNADLLKGLNRVTAMSKTAIRASEIQSILQYEINKYEEQSMKTRRNYADQNKRLDEQVTDALQTAKSRMKMLTTAISFACKTSKFAVARASRAGLDAGTPEAAPLSPALSHASACGLAGLRSPNVAPTDSLLVPSEMLVKKPSARAMQGSSANDWENGDVTEAAGPDSASTPAGELSDSPSSSESEDRSSVYDALSFCSSCGAPGRHPDRDQAQSPSKAEQDVVHPQPADLEIEVERTGIGSSRHSDVGGLTSGKEECDQEAGLGRSKSMPPHSHEERQRYTLKDLVVDVDVMKADGPLLGENTLKVRRHPRMTRRLSDVIDSPKLDRKGEAPAHDPGHVKLLEQGMVDMIRNAKLRNEHVRLTEIRVKKLRRWAATERLRVLVEKARARDLQAVLSENVTQSKRLYDEIRQLHEMVCRLMGTHLAPLVEYFVKAVPEMPPISDHAVRPSSRRSSESEGEGTGAGAGAGEAALPTCNPFSDTAMHAQVAVMRVLMRLVENLLAAAPTSQELGPVELLAQEGIDDDALTAARVRAITRALSMSGSGSGSRKRKKLRSTKSRRRFEIPDDQTDFDGSLDRSMSVSGSPATMSAVLQRGSLSATSDAPSTASSVNQVWVIGGSGAAPTTFVPHEAGWGPVQAVGTKSPRCADSSDDLVVTNTDTDAPAAGVPGAAEDSEPAKESGPAESSGLGPETAETPQSAGVESMVAAVPPGPSAAPSTESGSPGLAATESVGASPEGPHDSPGEGVGNVVVPDQAPGNSEATRDEHDHAVSVLVRSSGEPLRGYGSGRVAEAGPRPDLRHLLEDADSGLSLLYSNQSQYPLYPLTKMVKTKPQAEQQPKKAESEDYLHVKLGHFHALRKSPRPKNHAPQPDTTLDSLRLEILHPTVSADETRLRPAEKTEKTEAEKAIVERRRSPGKGRPFLGPTPLLGSAPKSPAGPVPPGEDRATGYVVKSLSQQHLLGRAEGPHLPVRQPVLPQSPAKSRQVKQAQPGGDGEPLVVSVPTSSTPSPQKDRSSADNVPDDAITSEGVQVSIDTSREPGVLTHPCEEEAPALAPGLLLGQSNVVAEEEEPQPSDPPAPAPAVGKEWSTGRGLPEGHVEHPSSIASWLSPTAKGK